MRGFILAALVLLLSPLILAEEQKPEIPNFIPDLFKGVFGQKIQLVTTFPPAPNCSFFPNATLEERAPVSFFALIPPSPAQPPSPAREKGEPLFVGLEEGEAAPLLAYLPLLNRLNAAMETASGVVMPFTLRVGVVERTSSEQALVATVDLGRGLLLVNRDMLRYLPERPSESLAALYRALEERLARARPEDFTLERFPSLLREHAEVIVEALQQDPIQCFFCVVIGGTLLALVANIGAYRYSLLACQVCGWTDEQCFTYSLYCLLLVYQNLALLAAILFRLCYDVCVALPHLVASL